MELSVCRTKCGEKEATGDASDDDTLVNNVRKQSGPPFRQIIILLLLTRYSNLLLLFGKSRDRKIPGKEERCA